MYHTQCFCHFLSASWKLCECAQYCLWFFLSHLSCVKWRYLQSGKQRKVSKGQVRPVGWVGDDSHVIFSNEIPWWKKKCYCIVVMQQQVVLSKFRRSLHTFSHSCHKMFQQYVKLLCSSPLLLFLVSVILDFPMGGLFLCLNIITVNQAVLTNYNPGQKCYIVGDYLMKPLTDIDTRLPLISCQNAGHKCCSDTAVSIYWHIQ
jgi:hypothetical protein